MGSWHWKIGQTICGSYTYTVAMSGIGHNPLRQQNFFSSVCVLKKYIFSSIRDDLSCISPSLVQIELPQCHLIDEYLKQFILLDFSMELCRCVALVKILFDPAG